MITLYTFGPMFGLPDPSPFCMKGEILLKMSGLPYRMDHSGFQKAPKGKQPYMDDAGTKVADTTFMRWHLETAHGIDFDPGLTAEQKATAWAFEKFLEDHVYWGIVRDRWVTGDNFDKGPRRYFDAAPALIRPLVVAKIRRDNTRTLWGQGIGRHSTQEAERLTIHGVEALSDFLSRKPFLMGDAPCGADATAFSFVAGLLCPLFDGPITRAAMARANLVAYRDRGMAKWYPGFKAV
jgi:Glutathione S-transferase N-terminal domain/Glutathione S-transferase, C-terminal domain